LTSAVEELQRLRERSEDIRIDYKARGANPELVSAYRVKLMLKLALCVAYGALQRTESRGAHYREDFPQRNDRDWTSRTLARWANPDDSLPSLSYEPLEIARMELPPGWRGYGAKDYIEHPDTAKRLAEIERIRSQLGDADPHTLQQALMPYLELLPERLRGRNERIDERFA
jgi:fumarate reductase flavoprotein subunit